MSTLSTSSSKEAMTFFFGADNCFSNWHPAGFVVKKVGFSNAEQFMMYCKAKLFKDEATAVKILAAKTPREQKSLGRQVQGFSDAIWVEKRELYVYIGCLAKFRQNPEMGKALLATGDSVMVEASPYDAVWGVGLSADNRLIQDRENWRGLNLLGKVLEKVRHELRTTASV